MQLEFHQLDRRWEHLRVGEPQRQRRLLASLADSGQQTPIVVVAAGTPDRYLVIDGHKRVAALEQLGPDTVEATVWAMSEAEAVLLSRSLRLSPQESALEQGGLLAEMEQRFGYGLDELARRFDRSPSWVSRRLALVELLPEAIQQQVREGKLAAQVAMKYLVPVARGSAGDCTHMAAAFVAHHCNTRQAGQLYTAWRQGTRAVRERILAEPELFLKTQRLAPPVTPAAVAQVERDLDMVLAILRRNHHKISVAVRIISLEESQGDFGDTVTKTNNRQNRIENRDFVALDPEQSRIRTELAIENIAYHVLREETATRTETAFDLVESTTALSCASGNVQIVVQLKREIGKLWESIDKVPYKALFNGSVPGMYVWRCVRLQRAIDRIIETILKEIGLTTGREYGFAVHGNRMISALVFQQVNAKVYKNPQADFDTLLAGDTMVEATRTYYARLKDAVAANYGNALIPTLFKNQTKCKDLFQISLGETAVLPSL